MKKVWLFGLFIAAVMFLAACSSQGEGNSAEAETNNETEETKETLTIEHELGTTEVPENPEKIAVFNYGTLSALDQLGIEASGVAKSSNIPSYLSKYEGEDYTNLGSLKEPDFETIYEMQPDLIIIAGRQGEAYEELKDIAPTLYLSADPADFMASYKEGMETLGQIFNKEDEVQTKLDELDETVAAMKETAENNGQDGLVVLSNGGKVSAYGPGSRFGMLHDVFGVQPTADDIEASTHGMDISFEYIAEKDPSYLFVVDRDQVVNGESAAAETLNNDLVNSTTAAQNDQMVYLDPELWYLSSGLPPIDLMAEEVKRALEE
ncbi:siderophore ABC transporter substrate-binding protein [Halobacillus kuroshimensis]|uniref:siderophore ABC transporter substrate-binding protein n=1 Tax=Halobacillus kuroshimensis TaxID=302481 RepID=UPI0004856FAC|nr:siderophore ABC transporter substrate-binding protein [Halobacillus kuroshimensis]